MAGRLAGLIPPHVLAGLAASQAVALAAPSAGQTKPAPGRATQLVSAPLTRPDGLPSDFRVHIASPSNRLIEGADGLGHPLK